MEAWISDDRQGIAVIVVVMLVVVVMGTIQFQGLHLCRGRLRTIARLLNGWRLVHARSLIHLDDPFVVQLLHATCVPGLDSQLTLCHIAAVAVRPFGQLPEGGTRLGVTSQLVVVQNGLIQVDALLGRRHLGGALPNALDDRQLKTSATCL